MKDIQTGSLIDKKIPIIAILFLSLMSTLSWGRELESLYSSPIIDDTGPKANTMFIMDVSNETRKAGKYEYLKEALLETISRYRSISNFGLSWTEKETPHTGIVWSQPFRSLNARVVRMKMSNFEENFDGKYKEVNDILSREVPPPGEKPFTWADWNGTPFAYTTYETSKYLRGLPVVSAVWNGISAGKFYKAPIEYRCQAHHIILFTGSYPNRDGIVRLSDADKALSDRLYNGSMSMQSLAILLDKMDLRDYYEGDAGPSWRGEDSQSIGVRLSTFAYGKNAATYIDPVRRAKGVAINPMTPDEIIPAIDKMANDLYGYRRTSNSIEDQVERSTKTIVYSAYYDPFSWLGEIVAYGYNPKSEMHNQLLWSSIDTLKPNSGNFITYNNGQTVPLSMSNLKSPTGDESTMKWLKGVDQEPYIFRQTPLASSVDNNMIYSAKDQLYINLQSMSREYRRQFIDYMIDVKRNQMPYNYIINGTNDGFINFIIADRGANGRAGERHTAYFFSKFADQLEDIARKKVRDHDYRINGKTAIFDAIINGKFQTLGITTLGAGGRGLAGYQIFAPGEKEIKVNFEITHRTPGFENLGYTDSQVEFFNRKNSQGREEAIAVFGNGEMKDGGVSSLFFIKADSGELIQEIVLSNDGGGASTPSLIVEEDRETGLQRLERIYVGDQSGKLYRIDFNNLSFAANDRFNQYRLSTLFDTQNPALPITVKPVLVQKNKEVWVYFGTGRAMDEERDKGKKSKVTHNFYGLRDDSTSMPILPSQLMGQSITSVNNNGQVFVSNKLMESGKKGWFLPLSVNGRVTGERIVKAATIYDHRYIHFTTYGIEEGATDGDPCSKDKPFSKMIFLNLFSGGASNAVFETGSGISVNDTLFNRSTGTVLSDGNLSGSGHFVINKNYLSKDDLIKLVGKEGSYAESDDIIVSSDCDIRNEDMNGNLHCAKFIPKPLQPSRIYNKWVF